MKLAIQNLDKYYGQQHVLCELSVEVEGVCSIGIIGPSGCGKSTLLRLLAGIEEGDGGTVLLNGLSPSTDKKKLQKQIGFVFQRHNLFPHLTLRDNLLLILEKIRKIPSAEAERRVDEVMAQLHLEGEQHKRPHQVSGGQGQRASIARALCTQPQLILLDEPTAALDPILTREVLDALVELRAQGREFIFVTHEMEFLRNFCDYVIFMEEGEIVEQGKVSCLTAPRTDRLRLFLSQD